jgi:hypothetical protein
MRTSTAAELVTRLEHSFILKASLIILGFGMLIISLTFVVWATFFRSQTKLISGVNLYTQPVVVKVGHHKAELLPFDSYNFTVSDFEPITVEITDTSGLPLTTRKHNLTRTAGIAIDILSDNDAAKFCFVSANVQALHYSTTSATSEPTNIQVIISEGANTLYYPVAAISNTVLVPDLYDGSKLPTIVDRQQRVWGIYPVDCNDISDKEALTNDIKMWSLVTAEQQRSLFAQKTLEVINSPEYNH